MIQGGQMMPQSGQIQSSLSLDSRDTSIDRSLLTDEEWERLQRRKRARRDHHHHNPPHNHYGHGGGHYHG